MKQPAFPVLVFYDGACAVCAAEIEHYLRRDHADRLSAVDISSPAFDPVPYRIPLASFIYELHVIDVQGEVYRGVDAFRAIWQAFPVSSLYCALGRFISLPLIYPVARIVYKGFARIRLYLPKRHHCAGALCRTGRH